MKEGCISRESEGLKVMEWGNAYQYAKNFHDSNIAERYFVSNPKDNHRKRKNVGYLVEGGKCTIGKFSPHVCPA